MGFTRISNSYFIIFSYIVFIGVRTRVVVYQLIFKSIFNLSILDSFVVFNSGISYKNGVFIILAVFRISRYSLVRSYRSLVFVFFKLPNSLRYRLRSLRSSLRDFV